MEGGSSGAGRGSWDKAKVRISWVQRCRDSQEEAGPGENGVDGEFVSGREEGRAARRQRGGGNRKARGRGAGNGLLPGSRGELVGRSRAQSSGLRNRGNPERAAAWWCRPRASRTPPPLRAWSSVRGKPPSQVPFPGAPLAPGPGWDRNGNGQVPQSAHLWVI